MAGITLTKQPKLPTKADLLKAAEHAVTEAMTAAAQMIKEGFDSEQQPGGGSKWPPNAGWYAVWKHAAYPGAKVLVLTGVMKAAALASANNYQVKASGDKVKAVATYSGPEYGLDHQNGINGQKHRPFFSFGGDGGEAIEKALKDNFKP